MASYDLDRFKRFIFDSKFLEVFVIDSETVEKLKTDDIELIQFGAKYIKYIMMMENTLKVREEVLNKEEKQEGSE